MNFQVRPHVRNCGTTSCRSNASRLFCKAAAPSAHTRAVSTRPWQRPTSIPTGSPGISIGAINAAIIAGTRPKTALIGCASFGAQATSSAPWHWPGLATRPRNLLNQMNANFAAAYGAKGFFSARPVTPWLQPAGTLEATSFYDTRALKHTLERLVDFDRLNAGMTRFSAGAVNVRTGNFVYFDNSTHTIGPEHIMASGALPPGFPAVEIEGEQYWDGGLVSNTPLQWMAETRSRARDTLAFQVDLWSARGDFPRNMFDVMTREKEIRYSSRTRAGTDQFKSCAEAAPRPCRPAWKSCRDDLKRSPEARLLGKEAEQKVYNVIHLIYRARNYEGHSKDYEFSRLSACRSIGVLATTMPRRTLRHREVLERPTTQKASSSSILNGTVANN